MGGSSGGIEMEQTTLNDLAKFEGIVVFSGKGNGDVEVKGVRE